MLLGAILSGVGWRIFFCEDHHQEKPLAKGVVNERRYKNSVDHERLSMRLESAKSEREKLEVMVELEFLSSERLAAMLDDQFEKTGDGDFDFSREALLITLAQADPLLAIDWIAKVWPFPEEADFAWGEERERACEIVAAEWAHQDAHGFLNYLEELKTADDQRFQISNYVIPELLLSGDPSAWMRVYHRKTNASVESENRFVDSLRDSVAFSQVLSSWDHFPKSSKKQFQEDGDGLEQKTDPKENRLAQKVIQRWKKKDPLGFIESRFVGWEKKVE